MSDGLVPLVLLVGSALVITWTLTYGWSLVARERFLTEMIILADDIDDEILAGTLPDEECVRFAWAKAHGVVKHVRMVSFSTAAATEMSAPELIGRSRETTYGRLRPAQRKKMHQYEDRFVASIERYLIHGSRLWFVLFVMTKVLNALRRPTNAKPPKRLAEDLSRAMDRSKVQTPKGPRVSFDLIPN